MTFSAHYLKDKIAWIEPEFLEQQLAESTKDKKTETNVNSMTSPKTTIRSNLLVDTTNTAIEIKSPAQTRKPTVSENLEMNALKVKLGNMGRKHKIKKRPRKVRDRAGQIKTKI